MTFVKNLNKGKKIILVLLLIALILGLILCFKTLWDNNKQNTSQKNTTTEFDENAIPIDENLNGEKLQQQQGENTVSITYSNNVIIDLSQNKLELLLANPKNSDWNMKIQMVIEDKIVAESGLIKPGYQLKQLKIKDDNVLNFNEQKGKLKVLCFEKNTTKKQTGSFEIPVTVTLLNDM